MLLLVDFVQKQVFYRVPYSHRIFTRYTSTNYQLNCALKLFHLARHRYADDVALIIERSNVVDLLRQCENHIAQIQLHTLYDQPLPRETIFAYPVVPFKPDGHLDLEELIQRNTHKTLATMNMLSSVGVNPSGFSKLLCTRFYAYIVRPQLVYGNGYDLV
ncbi:hypothetical protein BCV72DRAFT_309693 [Rhizopus microsporus var. microsporus]|uniref:Uncharacterized protein n=1 Tax=Rhizopus microsporus var. microsporus TaxID=86635 RepID=A0A1X0QPX9_RHIZD|nr:hypothetical protein BCV72DRAFT_309693 [Rhizopus microsporus var. microsporus]